jgi:uncharacterized cupin superfamily protein
VAEPPVAAIAAASAPLEPEPLAAEQVLEGAPETSAYVLATTSGGGESGVWRCTPGRFSDVEADETFVVLEGRATIEWEGGRLDLGPGDVCALAPGTETVWTVHETILKGFRIQPGE